jgi:urea transporter
LDRVFKILLYHLKAIYNSYAEIFFLNDYKIGAVLFLVTLINPNLGIAGLIAVLSAYLFARYLNMGEEFLTSGFYTYNPLLVGLSIGYLFKIDILTVFVTIVAGILTFIFSVINYSIFSYYFRLPILSLPFTIISSTIYLAIYNYSNLLITSLYAHKKFLILSNYIPIWISGYLKSLGAILFMPYCLAGIIFAILLFLASRILFMLSLLGYYVGTLTSTILTGSFYQGFNDVSHFNYILIAMALGGVYLIPSISSYNMAILAVILSTILLSATKTFLAIYFIPAFTLPFNIITLSMIYVLGLLNYPLIARIIRKTPEETLDFYLTNLNRFRGYDRTLHLPFAGLWTVWQGFNGKWTHKGAWKYAYDFIITDEEGKSYSGSGLRLEDYYAYRKPVLSPVRGRVVKVINDIPDNPIGEVNRENNWGNLVIIYDERGFYVEISHFAQYSIKVKEGDWVEVGTFLGLCGNSGYSPQPHIHVQAQLTDAIGAPTVPFSFVSYVSNNFFFSNDLPKEGEKVEPIFTDKSLDLKTSFVLDNKFHYEVFRNDEKVADLHLVVKMAPDGTFYFDSGKGRLYFGKAHNTFYFYRFDGSDEYLKIFFLALAKMPLAYRKNLQWEDFIPIKIFLNNIEKSIVLFISSFYHNFARVEYIGKFVDKDIIESRVIFPLKNTDRRFKVIIDEYFGFNEILDLDNNIKIKLKEFSYSQE